MILWKLYDQMKCEKILEICGVTKFWGKMFEIKVELFVLNHDWWLWWVGEDSDSLSRRPGIGMISGIAHVDSFGFRNRMPVADAQNPDIRCRAGRRQSGSTLPPPSTPGTLSLVLTRSSSTLFSGSDSLGHTKLLGLEFRWDSGFPSWAWGPPWSDTLEGHCCCCSTRCIGRGYHRCYVLYTEQTV